VPQDLASAVIESWQAVLLGGKIQSGEKTDVKVGELE